VFLVEARQILARVAVHEEEDGAPDRETDHSNQPQWPRHDLCDAGSQRSFFKINMPLSWENVTLS